jgi:hypothetical protein
MAPQASSDFAHNETARNSGGARTKKAAEFGVACEKRLLEFSHRLAWHLSSVRSPSRGRADETKLAEQEIARPHRTGLEIFHGTKF